jgi:CelD/BcsL family acetyltransferase involved in cellulose biosynthesis
MTIVEPMAASATVGGLAREWDSLADRTGAVPFLRPGWLAAWWDAFGEGSLEVLTASRGGRLVGILPLRRRRATFSSPTNAHTPAFGVLVEDQEAAVELGRALVERGAARIVLEDVDARAAALQALLQPALERGYQLLETTMQHSPYLPLDGDVADFERRLSAKRRSNLRRVRRRLESRGELALEVLDGSERLDQLLAEGFKVEGAAWKDARGSSILARADTRDFYTAVARWAVRRGSLRVAFLRLDGDPIAFDLCLEDERAHYLLKTGYNPDYRSEAPGMLMRFEMIRRAYALGIECYEFLGADQPWKLEWTDRCHRRARVRAYGPSAAGALARSARAHGGPIARKMIRRVPS